MSNTTESTFEANIEAHLLGNGWSTAPPSSYDREAGLFPDELIGFVPSSQPKEWAEAVGETFSLSQEFWGCPSSRFALTADSGRASLILTSVRRFGSSLGFEGFAAEDASKVVLVDRSDDSVLAETPQSGAGGRWGWELSASVFDEGVDVFALDEGGRAQARIELTDIDYLLR